MITPQIESVSSLARDYKSILAMLTNGPVFLAQRSKAAAVLVSVDEWTATANELARLRRTASFDRQFAAAKAGDYVDLENLDTELAAMNARTPDAASN